ARWPPSSPAPGRRSRHWPWTLRTPPASRTCCAAPRSRTRSRWPPVPFRGRGSSSTSDAADETLRLSRIPPAETSRPPAGNGRRWLLVPLTVVRSVAAAPPCRPRSSMDTTTRDDPPAGQADAEKLPRQHVIVIGLLLASAFVVILNETTMAVALRPIMDDLDITASTGQWLTTAFMLTMAVVIPAS